MEREAIIRTRAQQLRKYATKEENHLWYDFLRTHPIQFLRQKPFGPYVVDFYCHKAKLAIELDGSQHYEEEGIRKDAERTESTPVRVHVKDIIFTLLCCIMLPAAALMTHSII